MVTKKLTNVYLTRPQRRLLKQMARTGRTNMSALIREAIDRTYPQPAEAAK